MTAPDGVADPQAEPAGPLLGARRSSETAGWESTIAAQHGRRDYWTRRALAAGDALGVTLALLAAFALSEVRTVGDLAWLVPVLPVWIALFALYGLYSREVKRIGQGALDDLPGLFHALVIGTLLMWLYYHLLPVHKLVLREVVVFGFASIVLILGLRRLARLTISHVMGPERVLLVGETPLVAPLARKMRAHPEYALEPVGLILSGPGSVVRHAQPGSDLPVLGSLVEDELSEIIERHRVGRVVVAQEAVGEDRMLALLRECGAAYVKVSVLPRHVDAMGPSVEVDDIEGVTVLGLQPLVLSRSSRLMKRAMDLAGAGLGLLVLSPLLALAAIAIRLDSGGPVLFRQERVGKRGRVFSLLKFRTMVRGAQTGTAQLSAASEDPHWLKLERDPRVTRAGRVLRLSSIDELPQLWNVLRGQMSLVGPRPLIPSEDENVEDWARARLDISPGITGLWQVLGRASIPFEEMVKLDYRYVTNWSLWLDLRLLLRTLPAIVLRRGAN